MKVSYRWLGRHVDLAGLTPAEVADDLTIHTAEVEGCERFAPWLSDVVVGHVVERAKHPDADKLWLCRVDVGAHGEGQLLQIVCGANNVAAGQRVAVAVAGTTLPGDLKIKRSKIRGVESQGMICSERELALSDEHQGIWVLPGEPRIGAPVSEALDLDDWVLSIDNKSLTHRPDLWGHRGLALEVAAIRGLRRKPLDLALPRTGSGAPYPVRVESAGCARYLGLVIEGVRNGPSPEWMRFLLLAIGQRPLDLLVDLSNFVMLDLGQPNHLFDLARLSPDGIRVRDARTGERMHTLDGVERELSAEDVLITSGDEIVALAGVMGGEGSKVAPETSALLVEAASFQAVRVRRTAARLGLRTDASARFEKNLSPTLPAEAAAHVVNVLRSLQPGIRLPRPAGDAGQWKDPARVVSVSPQRVRDVLGAPVPDAEIERIFTGLELRVEKGAEWRVNIPSVRATKDLTIPEDLVEEVGRMHGYDRIPAEALPVVLHPAPWDDRRELVEALTERLGGAAHFHEAMTYSFVEDGILETLGLADEAYVRVVNPQATGADRVRRSVLPSLLGHLATNRRNRAEVKLFEMGKGYRPEHPNERGEPEEVHELAMVWMRPRSDTSVFGSSVLSQLQAVVQDLFRDVGKQRERWIAPGVGLPRWAHPIRAIAVPDRGISGGIRVAVLAALDPEVQSRLGLTGELDGEVACAEISIDRLLEQPPSTLSYRSLPRFPATKIDVAVAVPEERTAREVLEALWMANANLVADGEVFDVYRGPSVGAGKKSLAVHVFLRDSDRTLTERDVARYLRQVETSVASLGGELRKV